MKTLIAILFSLNIYSQNCNCESKPELKKIISCKKEKFSNGSTLSWQFDCNSSRLIFQNGKIKKTIFVLESDLMDFTGRLGYSNWKEYNTTFLIENRPVSGCCDPSEFILFDKNSGNIVKELGTYLYQYNKREDRKFIITLSGFDTIYVTDLLTTKIKKIKITSGRLENTLKNTKFLFANELFQEPVVTNRFVVLKYKYKNSKHDNWKVSTIKIDLNKGLLFHICYCHYQSFPQLIIK
ncbi:hypothetical protein [Epilithonimonas sp. UC225_85]|uniref:hypothetical protein n=1 Tax=Epilithonimonas sp. UC225_85 TaxID=3350167 RepID=UPI0036D415D6